MIAKKNETTNLELQLDSINSIIESMKSACQAMQNSNVQLLEDPPGMVVLYAHRGKLIC